MRNKEEMINIFFTNESKIKILIPSETHSGIKRVACKVKEDILRATLADCDIAECNADCGTEECDVKEPDRQNESALFPECGIEQAILAVTADDGETASVLENNIPHLRNVRGKVESYIFCLAENPLPGIRKAVIVYGSEKLGTIYGLFHLSRLLGIHPTIYWGDAPHQKRDVILESENSGLPGRIFVDGKMSKEPSVRYRGFFINDEWPCFGNWTVSKFGGFNAKMYDHIFEYLLRMNGNYLWPAMWASDFMLDGEGMANMELADEYGIYIGMSHHEPCMRSGAEYAKVRGIHSPYGDDWSYVNNAEGIKRFWEDGIKRSIGHNVLPTIGMRGENDSKLMGEAAVEENVRVLKEVITEQRKMIREHLPNAVQMFAVYKEVEDYYFGDGKAGLKGFEELDDVILLLCDDNHGNMRALPGENERNHRGGFGMYYHLDYHGDPVSYEWVSSTPVSKIHEQMCEAYEHGIKTLWIVNAGDVKFQEFGLNFFMDLAYDYETWGSSRFQTDAAKPLNYTENWVKDVFGNFADKEILKDIEEVLDGYIRLAHLRRPEALNAEIFHPVHYLESDRVLQICDTLEEKNECIYARFSYAVSENETPKDRAFDFVTSENAISPARDAYYSMIYYPAKAVINLYRMHLYAGKNHLYVKQGKTLSLEYAKKIDECIDLDERLKKEWANFKSGKWNHMQNASHIGFTDWNDEDCRYPVKHIMRPAAKPRLVVSRADEEVYFTNRYFPKTFVIEDFCRSDTEYVVLEVSNGGIHEVQWFTDEVKDWLVLSRRSGKTSHTDRLELRVNFERLNADEDLCEFCIRTETEFVPIAVKVKKPFTEEILKHAYLLENQTAIPADGYCRSIASKKDGGEFKKLENFGKFGTAMKVMPSTRSYVNNDEAPALVYELYTREDSRYLLQLHTSPANPLVYNGSIHFCVGINDTEFFEVNVTGENYRGGDGECEAWAKAVLNAEHRKTLAIDLKKGINTISIHAREAGAALLRLSIYKDGVPKESYMGIPIKRDGEERNGCRDS